MKSWKKGHKMTKRQLKGKKVKKELNGRKDQKIILKLVAMWDRQDWWNGAVADNGVDTRFTGVALSNLFWYNVFIMFLFGESRNGLSSASDLSVHMLERYASFRSLLDCQAVLLSFGSHAQEI